MFDTKLEVDRHVESCLKKLNNETERSLKCLAFARLYFKVGEYEQARRYAAAYLTVKPLSAEGLSLLGKTLEKQEKPEAAIEAYRKSLDIDPKQNQLVIKVCELLSSDNVNIDLTGARYFCERAQSLEPHNPVVFSLKERLVAVESQDPSDVTQLLLTELRTRPSDVQLRVRLLRHYLQHNQIREAYVHASEFQKENYLFNSLVWYETVAEVLVRYQRENATSSNLTWEFWMLLISVMDKLAALTLDERASSAKSGECVSVIFNLDQTLTVASKNVTVCNERPLLQEFLNHYRAQLCFHLMVLLFKQAKRDLLTYKEAMQMALPLLFISYHAQPPELNSMWLERCPEARRKQIQRWHKEAAFRCSQSGHILLAVAKDRKMAVVEKAMQSCSGLWREHLFKKLFVTRDQQAKLKTSYFVTCPGLVDVTVQLPEANDVVAFDQIAQKVFSESMHHLIWICLTQKLPTFKCTVFEGLPYSVKHLNNCSAESLSVLDVEAFLYCASLTVQQQLEDAKHQGYYNNDRPSLLPAAVTSQMGTQNQTKWYTAAYRMYLHEYSSDMSELRLNLIRGLEVVRCVGNHGLDVKLLVILATTFAERAKHLTKQSEVESNEARAELYWKAALPVLEKMQKNQAVTYANNRLFEFKSKEMNPAEVAAWIDEGKLFNATLLMKKKEHERALQIFEGLKSPYASFYQSQIYKAMAEEQVNQNKENVTSEMRSQHIILLSKARDCLYLTLDRLRDPSTDRKHPLNQQLGSEIEKIERLLSRIDPDIYNHRNECDGMSDENVSSAGSVDHLNNIYSSTFTNSFYHDSLTPQFDRTINNSTRYRLELPQRREARPSPERLDAQLRQMQASRDATINHILEQNRIMLDSHRSLVDELKGFKDVVSNLTSTVEELKQQSVRDEMQNIKKCVTDLKNAFDELKNFQDVKDVVHEMKKELSELKKDNKPKTNQNQLSEEDLYVLEEEYGADYGLNSNVAALNPMLYPRLPSASSLTYPPALYPGLYPMYPYTGLGLPQANLPFGQDAQIPDFRALHTLSQLPQTSYAQATLTQPKPWEVVQPTIPPTLVQPPAQPALAATTTSAYASPTMNRSAPVNVVITSSDPLPKTSIQTTQVLSVTIPPQHLKGNVSKSQPHNYQIPLPTSSVTTPAPAIIHQPPLIVSTQGLLSNVAPPMYSAIDKSPKNAGLGLQIEKSLAQSFSADKTNSPNKSNASVEEHDPCPDFKPIIPLPDEVPVNTGEEHEKVLFCERAKLFRFTNKEWKERGIGNIKILQSSETGKIRILMRRDQVHKICANHLLTKDMALTAMPNNSRAYIWAAHDYADEEMVVEKFCVRFKTEEEANAFCAAFEKAKDELKAEASPTKVATPTPTQAEITATMGGFKFTSTPTFKPKEATPPPKIVATPETTKTSPFASFSFTPKSDSKTSFQFGTKLFTTPEFKPLQPDAQKSPKTPEDFEPSVEFSPVVPLPELIDVKTGEENAEILFEGRSKLLRYDPATKEWKERGVGIMKLLKESTIRLVMRREQVLKVCCNHQLLKSMQFSKMANSPKALTWYAQDFSEGVLKAEMFAIRFKLEEQADAFFKAVTSAQDLLDENNTVKSDKMVTIPEIKADVQDDRKKEDKKVKSEPEPPKETPKGWGDKFKPKLGSWECKNCYIVNEPKNHHCIACETPKSTVSPKKDTSPSNLSSGTSMTTTFSFGRPITTTSGVTITPIPTPEAKKEPASTLSFATTTATTTSSWGDAFKPKQGSWKCEVCLVRNDADKQYCVSCESPKDDTVPKKEAKGVNLDTPGLQFNFGLPAKTTTSGFSFARTTSTFTFGSTSVTTTEANTKPFSFTLKGEGDAPKAEEREFVFGSPQKHSFEFTPRSPGRHSGCQGDEESDSFVEDDGDHIYFKPVIPLPDKVEVKTGEEQEQVLYCHRAKLFRFVQGEWKERGLGDIKILHNTDTNKLRVVMRRDQVLKICLNHVLTSEVEYLPKDEKTWLFSAPDFSEGEINRWQFCIRFKNAEVAQKFKKAVDDALEKVTDDSKPATAGSEEPSDEVEFVSETQVTPDEEQEAVRLMLPPKFMAYRQLPDCACETCKKDDELLAELFQKKASVFGLGTPCKPSAFDSSNSGGFMFGTPMKNFSFGSAASTPTTLAKSESLKDMLMKPSVLSDIANKEKEVKTAQDVGKTLAEIKPDVKVKSEAKTPAQEAMKNFTFSLSTTAPQTPTESAFSQSKPSIFASTTVSSLFTGTTTPTGSLFDSSTKTSTFGTFGSTSVSMGNIFSSPSTFSSGSIFGTPTAVTASEMKPLFGSTAPLFGPTANTPTFADLAAKGEPAQNTPTVADLAAKSEHAKTPLSFGDLAAKTESAKPEAKQDELVLKCDSNLSFSTLAAASPNMEAFKTTGEDGKPFAFLGSGTPVFASLVKTPPSQKKKDKSKDETETSEAEAEGGEEYDPHYEPIVPLPDAIVVSTGEEEEEQRFNERAKLFRYDNDNKEWKERGIGQMKILYHPKNGTYRFLLRREQVHKLVLNMLITPAVELQPMSTSDKAWLWYGYNHSVDEAAPEKLAIRFKNCELAQKFHQAVQDAVAAIKEQQEQHLPASIQNFGIEDISSEHEASHEEEDDEEDDRTIMFIKPCTLSEQLPSGEWKDAGSGELQVYYDPDIYGSRISVCDDTGLILSNSLIGINTEMTVHDDHSCTWKAVDWAEEAPRWRMLKASFEEQQPAEEFHCNYLESLQFAHESDLVDGILAEQPDTDED